MMISREVLGYSETIEALANSSKNLCSQVN